MRQNILQLVPAAVAEVFNFLIHFYQTAQDCLFPHDIGIRFDIDRGRYRGHDIPDEVQAADLRRNIFLAQPVLKRYQIDRLSLVEKLDHGLKHDAILVLVKIGACDNLRRRDNCFTIHKHGSDDRLFCLYTMRENPLYQGFIHDSVLHIKLLQPLLPVFRSLLCEA